MTDPTILRPEDLQTFGKACFQMVGVPAGESGLLAQSLLEADARGVHSHGFLRLPTYVSRMQQGYVSTELETTVETETENTALVNGHFSAGPLVAGYAMRLATRKADRCKVAVVAVKNSSHFGMASRYPIMAVQKDMIGAALTNTSPLMPPVGSRDKVIGNNPISVAVPSNNEYPFVLDMALSTVAMGKVLFARSRGSQIPDHWGVDEDGLPTTDPAKVAGGGSVTPLGGPKGFGLALVVEALTGVLVGGPFAKDVRSMFDFSQQQSISHLLVALDISAFTEVELFKERMSALSKLVKGADRAQAVPEIFLPGEPEFSLERERMATGIPIEESVLADLQTLAATLKVPPLRGER